MQTVKSAVEPQTRAQWEERLASYVRTGFEAQLLGAGGQQALQYVSKLTTALLLLFGAYAVINNDLTIGALVAFNMISNQMVQLILRLS
jgi:ATP-binding cassette, subfamily B, bacterial HlyB/CyaB